MKNDLASKIRRFLQLLLVLPGLFDAGRFASAQQMTPFPKFDGRIPVEEDESPSADTVFNLTAVVGNNDTVLIQFTSAPGYYLYRNRISVDVASGDGISVASFKLPVGELKNDPNFGETEVLQQSFSAVVTLRREPGASNHLILQVTFAGSNKNGIRSPTINKNFDLILAAPGQSSKTSFLCIEKNHEAMQFKPLQEAS